MTLRRRVVTALLVVVIALALAPAVSAEPIEHTAFERTWARTDMPLVTRQALRTWMWGPAAASTLLSEPYAESPGGRRIVQYFDKSRMEINNRDGDRSSPWYVTNGLLASELISGRMAVGDSSWIAREPAVVNVAGDPDDATGPTYATFATLLGTHRTVAGAPIVETLARDGSVASNPWLAQWGATDAEWVSLTGHWVASPFWAFMQSQGVVYEEGVYATEPLFENPFYATGYPITDAYWANVKVGGVYADVLMQCFERRCLTYLPTNAPEWRSRPQYRPALPHLALQADRHRAGTGACQYRRSADRLHPARPELGGGRRARVRPDPQLRRGDHPPRGLASQGRVRHDLHLPRHRPAAGRLPPAARRQGAGHRHRYLLGPDRLSLEQRRRLRLPDRPDRQGGVGVLLLAAGLAPAVRKR